MNVHTTNYFNTFISAADDCPETEGQVPPLKLDNKTIANLQFELVEANPYKYTSDEVLFSVFATRNQVPKLALEAEQKQFFSKGQACFRASPLTKRYAWGVHFNEAGKMAIYAKGTEAYNQFAADTSLKQLKAMKSKR